MFLYKSPLLSALTFGVSAAGPSVLIKATVALPTQNTFEVRHFSPSPSTESYHKPDTPDEQIPHGALFLLLAY